MKALLNIFFKFLRVIFSSWSGASIDLFFFLVWESTIFIDELVFQEM